MDAFHPIQPIGLNPGIKSNLNSIDDHHLPQPSVRLPQL
jgi:hypothetical protein